jgi:hypothetical protein
MMLHKDKCLELGLPEPLSFDNQISYTKRVLVSGLRFDTRKARYCGIGNLHNLVSLLKKSGVVFNSEHGQAKCPFTGKTPPHHVDIISMTPEQIAHFQKEKTAKKN